MESSPLIMEAEECSSSESGWTMYLSSPMHDGGDSDIEVQANDEEEEDDADDHNSSESDDGSEGEDNDSMASDASTGPIQHKHGDTKCDDRSSLMCHLDHDDDDDGVEEDERNQYCLSYSCNKFCEVNKMRSGRRVGVSHKEDDAASLLHTSSKEKKASGK